MVNCFAVNFRNCGQSLANRKSFNKSNPEAKKRSREDELRKEMILKNKIIDSDFFAFKSEQEKKEYREVAGTPSLECWGFSRGNPLLITEEDLKRKNYRRVRL